MFPIIERTALVSLKAIMDDEYTDVLQRFLDESLSLMNVIHGSLENTNEQLLSAIDVLVVASKEVGARRLVVYMHKLEAVVKNHQQECVDDLMKEINEIFTETHQQLKRELSVTDKLSA